MAYALITTPDNSWNILNSHYTKDISAYLGDENVIKFGGTLESEFNAKYEEEFGKKCVPTFKTQGLEMADTLDDESEKPDLDSVPESVDIDE